MSFILLDSLDPRFWYSYSNDMQQTALSWPASPPFIKYLGNFRKSFR